MPKRTAVERQRQRPGKGDVLADSEGGVLGFFRSTEAERSRYGCELPDTKAGDNRGTRRGSAVRAEPGIAGEIGNKLETRS